jgi:cell division protein FtsB
MAKFLLILVLVMGGLGYWYYKDSQATIQQLMLNNATLKANQLTLEETIRTNNETIARQQADAAQFAAANDQLRSQLVEAEAYSDDLQAKLRNHNLTVLTAQRPGLIETRVNRATARLFDELEQITGATPPTITADPE